jgi:hypothetical protein
MPPCDDFTLSSDASPIRVARDLNQVVSWGQGLSASMPSPPDWPRPRGSGGTDQLIHVLCRAFMIPPPRNDAFVTHVIGGSRSPLCSPLRALTTGLRWSNHEGHEGHEAGTRRSAESNERLCDRGSRAPRVGTARWQRTLLSLIPSCSSCASWSTDRPDPLACHGHIPRAVANKSVHRSGRIIRF